MAKEAKLFLDRAYASDDVYLANAAAGLMSCSVLSAVRNYLDLEARKGAPYAAAAHQERLERGYSDAARLVGANSDEIAFVESGNSGLSSLILSAGLSAGDHVLVDRTSWGGTLDMLSSLNGITVDVMPVDQYGRVMANKVRDVIDACTKMIILTWCPATSGMVNPAAEIGLIAAEAGITYIIDACQILGQRPVDVNALRCQGLVASGRKWLRGPRGTALLYASRAYLNTTQAFMADQFGRSRRDARRYERGEAYLAGRVGLAVAIEGALAIGIDSVKEHTSFIAHLVRERLTILPRVTIIDDGDEPAAIVGFAVSDKKSIDVCSILERRGISVSALTCAYTPLGLTALGLNDIIRVAPQIYTKEDDVKKLIEAVAAIVN